MFGLADHVVREEEHMPGGGGLSLAEYPPYA
jgi:hypothetical protein